jgi:hypothetical protein
MPPADQSTSWGMPARRGAQGVDDLQNSSDPHCPGAARVGSFSAAPRKPSLQSSDRMNYCIRRPHVTRCSMTAPA